MNLSKRKEYLKRAGRDIIKTYFYGDDNFPLASLSGSIGDPYGVIHPNSDVDVELWTYDAKLFSVPTDQSSVEWNGYNWKRKIIWKDMIVEVLEDKKKNHEASVVLRYINREEVPKIFNNLETVVAERLDFFLEHFVETENVKDTNDMYKTLHDVTKKTFESRRMDVAKEILSSNRLELLLKKLKDNMEILKYSEIDVGSYNAYVREIVNNLTYAACCIEGLPRSFGSIESRRNNNLWERLGMNISEINCAYITKSSHRGDMNSTLTILEYMIKDLLDRYQKVFG